MIFIEIKHFEKFLHGTPSDALRTNLSICFGPLSFGGIETP